jgi:hypothetical protein
VNGANAPDGISVEAGLADIEGYLLWSGEIQRAQAEADTFADALDWLTADQREQIVGALTLHHLALARQTVTRTARRAAQLRQEYEDRYALLRRRLLASALLLGATTVFADCLVLVR